MSKQPSPTGSQKSAAGSRTTVVIDSNKFDDKYYETCQEPDFIYGGPFINVKKPEPFLDTKTPMNLPMSGSFKRSYAYYSLKERLPVILTKVIDECSKRNDGDMQKFIAHVAKLKSELITNKKYLPLEVDTEEAKKWNEYIEACDQPHYFTNSWVWTECYVYRRLREGCELIPSLSSFDYFADQKEQALKLAVEPMCVVAEKMGGMLQETEDKDKRKADFIALLKICLWSNKCDLSLSLGEPVSLPPPAPPGAAPPGGKGAPGAPGAPPPKEGDKPPDAPPPPPAEIPLVDPFQLIIDYKDKLIVDDTNKISDQVITKAEKIAENIANNTVFKCKCSCHRLAKVGKTRVCMDEAQLEAAEAAAALAAAMKAKGGKGKPPPPPPPPPPPEPKEGEPPPPPPIPCPAKVTVPSAVQFDIVCDNSGYELFTDLCLAHFLVAQKIVQKVRFHVKQIPWFVSDVTPEDFKNVIKACETMSFARTVQPPEPKPVPEVEEPPPREEPRSVSSAALNALASQWSAFLADGTFVVMSDDYWTSPNVYRDMKKLDYWLYRKLQFACAILFKGDLNYRKLVGERACNPYAGFEPSLQGFIPAPIIAVRTVKSETVCGMPRGKFDAISKIDPKWMEKGDYGVIQFCAKAEPLKVSDRPCAHYCSACMGLSCPEEGAFW